MLLLAAAATAGLLLLIYAFILYKFASLLRARTPTAPSRMALPNKHEVAVWNHEEIPMLYDEIFGAERCYDREGIVYAPGSVIFDVGANIGLFALFAVQQCGGDARVFSFEPIPRTFDVLKINCDAVNAGEYGWLTPNHPTVKPCVTPMAVGVGAKAGRLTFNFLPNCSVMSTSREDVLASRGGTIIAEILGVYDAQPLLLRLLFPRALVLAFSQRYVQKLSVAERVDVPVITLSDAIDSHKLTRVDLAKIDVEGAELAVLQGIRDAHWPLIQQLMVETETFAVGEEVNALLTAKGFTCKFVESRREQFATSGSEISMVYARRIGSGDVPLPPPAAAAATTLKGAKLRGPSPGRKAVAAAAAKSPSRQRKPTTTSSPARAPRASSSTPNRR